MKLLAASRAELRKTISLPGALAAIAIATLGSIGITLLNATTVRNAIQHGQPELVADTSAIETVFAAVPLGTVGAVILGVLVISSEYTANSPHAGGGRQITATLTATPRRLTVLTAKAIAVVAMIVAVAAVTIVACLVVAHTVMGDIATWPDNPGDAIARSCGVAVYWVLMSLISLAITVVARSGLIPLIVLIVNSSLVSISLLLTHLTPLARYLPDLAGIRLFARDSFAFDKALDPLTGGLVMAAWTIAFLTVSAVIFARRDS